MYVGRSCIDHFQAQYFKKDQSQSYGYEWDGINIYTLSLALNVIIKSGQSSWGKMLKDFKKKIAAGRLEYRIWSTSPWIVNLPFFPLMYPKLNSVFQAWKPGSEHCSSDRGSSRRSLLSLTWDLENKSPNVQGKYRSALISIFWFFSSFLHSLIL